MELLTDDISKSIVFFYHKNQQDFVLKLYFYLKNRNYPVLIDIQDGFDQQNVERISLVICILSPMYQSSKICRENLEFIQTKRIPIIAIRILPNWKPSGWLHEITRKSSIINFYNIKQKFFEENIQKLEKKMNYLFETNSKSQLFEHESFLGSHCSVFFYSKTKKETDFVCHSDEPTAYSSSQENVDLKKKPLKYVDLDFDSCSNLLICNHEYILLHANQTFHLFDKNLKLIRSQKTLKINENNLKDMNWCEDLKFFLILTRKELYLLNSLTIQLTTIENLKIKNNFEEYISSSCLNDQFCLIKYHSMTKFYSFEQYQIPTFRFLKKYFVVDLLKQTFFIQNGFSNQHSLEEIVSLKHFEDKLLIIMKISSQWFISIFHFIDQPIYLNKIRLEEKSRLTILNPINQWIIFKDSLSNSFLQISIDFQNDQQFVFQNYSKAVIDFQAKLRSVALYGLNHLVLLIDHTLLIYQL